MSPRISRYKIPLLIVLIILSLLVLAYSLKSPVFRFVLAKKVERVQQKYGIQILYSKAILKGFTTPEIRGLEVRSAKDSAILNASRFAVKLPISSLLTLKISPIYVSIDSLNVNLNSFVSLSEPKGEKIQAFDFDTTYIQKYNWGSILTTNNLYRGLKGLIIFINTRIEINGLNAFLNTPNQGVSISTDKFISQKGNYNATFRLVESGISKELFVEGKSQEKGNSLTFNVFTDGLHQVKVPFVNSLLGLSCELDSLHYSMVLNELKRENIELSTYTKVNNLKLQHPQISDKEVSLDFAELNINARFTQNGFHIDSTSYFTVNSLSIPISLRVDNQETPRATLKIHKDSIDAKAIFESLPAGLFPTLKGVKVNGLTEFDLLFDVDFANLENLTFQSKLTSNSFKLLSHGAIDFTMLNDSFTHHIYSNDSIIKSILLHPYNKVFWSLERISPYLKNAVVVAEDGGFYRHKGFDADGFRFALARNIKDRRLSRGGSTITMQLVKNVYLNRNKTLTRKAEEALIVWLIETQQLVEKDRILEIYLNIIDWGPNINGIGEAAEFYFEKTPDKLDLNEAIFLASIIPRPNQFMHSFDVFGNLRDHYNGYYQFVAGTMRDRGFVTDEELNNLVPLVNITGPAKFYLKSSTLLDDETSFE